MNVITQTWATIPNYPNYEILYDRSKGEKIRRKKEPRGQRMGISSAVSKTVGGRALVVTVDGWVTFKTGPNSSQERQKSEEVWAHVFQGKALPTPAERKVARMAEAKIAREEKAAREAEVKRLARAE